MFVYSRGNKGREPKLIIKKIKVMLNKIDFRYLVAAVGALSLGILTMTGIIQQYICFAGMGNEIWFAFISIVMGGMLMFGIKK